MINKTLIAVMAIGVFFPTSHSLADTASENCVNSVKKWINRKGAISTATVQSLAENYCFKNGNEVEENCLSPAYREAFADSKNRTNDAITYALNKCSQPTYYTPPN